MVCVWHTLFWKIKNVGHTLPNLDIFYIPLTNGFFTWLQASTNRTIHMLERKRVTNLEILFITNCLEKKKLRSFFKNIYKYLGLICTYRIKFLYHEQNL
jgi:hypothetical protein